MPVTHDSTGPLNPFGEISPAFRFYPSLSHRKIAHRIARGLEAHCGLILLTGEIGSGKTSVSRHLRQEYAQTFDFVVLDNPQLGPAEQAARILRVVGADQAPGAHADPVDALCAHLEAGPRAEGRTVLVFDECHLMGRDHFEQIQVLSNLRAGAVPLVQILLVGQVEIKEMLRRPGFEALNQRIGVRCELEPLSLHDTREYVAFKLREGNYPEQDVFEPQAVERLWALSGGLPRLINHACAHALDQVTFCGLTRVTPALVDEVGADPMYRDLYAIRTTPRSVVRRGRAAVLAALALAAALGLAMWQGLLPGTGGGASTVAERQAPATAPVQNTETAMLAQGSGPLADGQAAPASVPGDGPDADANPEPTPTERDETLRDAMLAATALLDESQLPRDSLAPQPVQQETDFASGTAAPMDADLAALDEPSSVASTGAEQDAPDDAPAPFDTAADGALDGLEHPVIGAMHIDAVAWADAEAERLAVLDGTIVRPGGVVQGVTLETIGHNYLYFLYEDQRYKRLWNLSGQ